MRLLIAVMKHETNAFSPVPTPLAGFGQGPGPLYGEAAIRAYRGTGTGLGAYLDLAEQQSAEIVLPIAAGAPLSGPVEDERGQRHDQEMVHCPVLPLADNGRPCEDDGEHCDAVDDAHHAGEPRGCDGEQAVRYAQRRFGDYVKFEPTDGDNKRPRRHSMQPRATFTVLIRYEDLHSARGTANGDRRAYRRRSRPMLGQVDGRQTVEAADDVACTSKPIQGRMVNAGRIYGLCPLRPGLSLPVNLGRQGRTGSGALPLGRLGEPMPRSLLLSVMEGAARDSPRVGPPRGTEGSNPSPSSGESTANPVEAPSRRIPSPSTGGSVANLTSTATASPIVRRASAGVSVIRRTMAPAMHPTDR